MLAIWWETLDLLATTFRCAILVLNKGCLELLTINIPRLPLPGYRYDLEYFQVAEKTAIEDMGIIEDMIAWHHRKYVNIIPM